MESPKKARPAPKMILLRFRGSDCQLCWVEPSVFRESWRADGPVFAGDGGVSSSNRFSLVGGSRSVGTGMPLVNSEVNQDIITQNATRQQENENE